VMALKVMSSRLPIGVGTMYNFDIKKHKKTQILLCYE
jgi:hypothetical protein